jgi:hypothetical protein
VDAEIHGLGDAPARVPDFLADRLLLRLRYVFRVIFLSTPRTTTARAGIRESTIAARCHLFKGISQQRFFQVL